ncbi:rRNA maturation RNase YbeY [Thermoproteota archaeon]
MENLEKEVTAITQPVICVNNPAKFRPGFSVKAFVQKILDLKHIKSGSFSFTFIKDEEIKQLNHNYLGKDYATDILSFNLAEKDKAVIGDVYISVEQARVNAREFNNNFKNEIKLLLIHGILHLLEYRDYNEKERKVMFNEQQRLLELAAAPKKNSKA